MEHQHMQTSEIPLGLSITRKQFCRLYPDLSAYYDFFNNPIPAGVSNEYIEKVYFASKLWRLNNLYTIVGKNGKLTTFKMNYAQHKTYAASRIHPRLIILKSRQQGISTLFLVSFFDDAVWAQHFSIGLMAQGTDEASTLLERVKLLWERLDPNVKAYAGVKLVNDNAVKFSLTNKSSIFIRVSFRSTTLQRLHISEFGKIANANPKRAKETKTGTLQALAAGMTGIIESTAEGNNDFQLMWDAAMIAVASGQLAPKDFMPVFLPWIEDPDCTSSVTQIVTPEAELYFMKLERELNITLTEEQKNFWIIQYRELDDDIYQEYPATPHEAFAASRDGTYYAKLFNIHVLDKGRIVKNLYDPNLPVEVFIDLGMDDYFVMGFCQWYRGEYRIVDEYLNDGYDMTHYIDVAEAKGYNIVAYKFPHDISVRELTATGGGQRAKSRQEILQEYFKLKGITARIIKLSKDANEANGIEATRRMIKSMWVDPKCTYLIACCLNFTRAWNDKLHIWKDTPADTEWNHGADVLRAIAQHTQEHDSMHESSRASVRKNRNHGAAL